MPRSLISFLCRGSDEATNVLELGKEAAEKHLAGAGPLGVVIEKIAAANGLNEQQLARVVEVANNEVFHQIFHAQEKPEDRYVEFEVAKTAEILRKPKLVTKQELAESEKTADPLFPITPVDTQWFHGKDMDLTRQIPGSDHFEKTADPQQITRESRTIPYVVEHVREAFDVEDSRARTSTNAFVKAASDAVLAGETSIADLDFFLEYATECDQLPEGIGKMALAAVETHVLENWPALRDEEELVKRSQMMVPDMQHPLLRHLQEAVMHAGRASQLYQQLAQIEGMHAQHLQKLQMMNQTSPGQAPGLTPHDAPDPSVPVR